MNFKSALAYSDRYIYITQNLNKIPHKFINKYHMIFIFIHKHRLWKYNENDIYAVKIPDSTEDNIDSLNSNQNTYIRKTFSK